MTPVACRIRGRVLFGYLAISALLGAAVLAVLSPPWSDEMPPPWAEAVFDLVVYASLFLFLWRCAAQRGVNLRDLIARWPNPLAVGWALCTAALLFGITVASLHAFYFPLLYHAPDVLYWLEYLNPFRLLWPDLGSYHLTLIDFLVMILLGPFIEELFFRGLLLPSWVSKWGTTKGVVLSSAAFATLHLNMVDTFVFGVAASVVFLRTQQLWYVFIFHAVHNGILSILPLLGVEISGPSPHDSEATFLKSWLLGVTGFLVCLALLYVALRRAPKGEPIAQKPLPGC